MIDDHMFSATYGWDYARDAQIRAWNVVDPARVDPMGPLARTELVEMGTIMGHEGDDYQNPNVWQGRGVLAYPTVQTPGLVPTFGIDAGESYADLVLNVRATQHLAVINV